MSEPFTALATLFSLAILTVLLLWLYRDYAVDSFRQHMFDLRDEFFDEAEQGNVDFDSPAYGMLRSTMNGSIRFAHRLNFAMVVAVLTTSKGGPGSTYTPFAERLQTALKQHDPETKKLILSYYRRMNLLILRHVMIGSPITLVTVVVPLVFAFETKYHLDRIVRTLKRPLDRLDSAALDIGDAV